MPSYDNEDSVKDIALRRHSWLLKEANRDEARGRHTTAATKRRWAQTALDVANDNWEEE